MARFAFVVVFLLSGVLSAHSEDTVHINSIRDTGRLDVMGTSLTAFYTERDRAFDVTLLLEDDEGSVLRSGVRLSDGQSHELRLAGDAGLPGTRFLIVRSGASISLSGGAHPGPELATSD